MRRRLVLLLAGTLVSMFGAACGGGPEEESVREEQVREETPQEEQIEGEVKEKLREGQEAGYYGEEFAGSPTASGEPYDPYGFTAAHPYLPFGTVLEVCYHGCTRVTVNDRNPYSATDLDLSRAAADDIGLTPDGYGVVDAEVVE